MIKPRRDTLRSEAFLGAAPVTAGLSRHDFDELGWGPSHALRAIIGRSGVLLSQDLGDPTDLGHQGVLPEQGEQLHDYQYEQNEGNRGRDGREGGCVWHSRVLSAASGTRSVGPGYARVAMTSRYSDSICVVPSVPWLCCAKTFSRSWRKAGRLSSGKPANARCVGPK